MKNLKPPEMKVPKTLVDLYQDLRDRHLLPLVALLVVAIIAAPIMLSEKGDDQPTDATLPTASARHVPPLGSPEGSRLTVVKVDPGIRNPRKRLAGRREKNPFAQPGAASGLGGNSTGMQAPPATTTTTTTGTTESSSSSPPPVETAPPSSPTTTTPAEVESTEPSGGGDGGGSPGTSPPKHQEAPAVRPPSRSPEEVSPSRNLIFYTFDIEVRIAKRVPAPENDEGAGTAPTDPTPVVKSGVAPATPLPGAKEPVVTYMGAKEGKTALLMVSNEVSEIMGEGKCLSGTGTCQLIALEPHEPEIFVYGPNKVRYKVEVLGMKTVVTGHS
ncbi:MAG: hypothetical protein ACRDPE_07630 [Solirubrobacterales bacterium]